MRSTAERSKNVEWIEVHYPLKTGDLLPPEKKVVLVWLGEQKNSNALPYCGYLKYAAGDKGCPYFVVYHGNSDRGVDVIAWCDCLPDEAPAWAKTKRNYEGGQKEKRRRRAQISDEAYEYSLRMAKKIKEL